MENKEKKTGFKIGLGAIMFIFLLCSVTVYLVGTNIRPTNVEEKVEVTTSNPVQEEKKEFETREIVRKGDYDLPDNEGDRHIRDLAASIDGSTGSEDNRSLNQTQESNCHEHTICHPALRADTGKSEEQLNKEFADALNEYKYGKYKNMTCLEKAWELEWRWLEIIAMEADGYDQMEIEFKKHDFNMIQQQPCRN